ncbi:MAG TPA: hypothetical protein VMV68_03370 [Spirochaetia bacterium]|nr:hypothetical protein [Spirochaetia bacterium]
MSDLLTHWAVFEDIRRLAGIDPKMSRELVSIIERERQYARLGSVSRSGVRFVPEILMRARNLWPQAKGAGGEELALLSRKVAYGVGGIAHFPADYILKPLMSRLTGADWNATHHEMQMGTADAEALEAIQEISVYYDLKVFREVYLSGREEPFNAYLLSVEQSEPTKALEEFVTTLFQRALLASHTLAPDTKNLDAWLDNLIGQVQPLYLSVERYVRVFQSPDPEKSRQYGVDTEFYRAEDPAVAAARAVHRGERVGAERLEAAVAEGANQGGYGKAVALGLRSFRQASDFWEHRSEELPDVSQG